MIICNQCGAPIKDAARFCKECGAGVAGTSGAARQTAPLSHSVTGEQSAPRHLPSFTTRLAVGGGLLLAVLLLLFGLSATRSHDAPAVNYNSSDNANTLNSSSDYSSNNAYANAGGQMNRGQMNTASSSWSNRNTNSGGKWVVILSGNASLAKAEEFARKIEVYRPTMYFREGLYRTTVGPYRTREMAVRARDQFRVEIIGDAYVENMDTWCRNVEPSNGILACK